MVKLIVAKASNDVIGKDNDLIWHLPADMRFFTQTTKGHIVVMGRRNWDSIPLKYRPLSERINVVISRNKDFKHPDCLSFQNLEDALAHFKNEKDRDIFIIGGGQIYRDALDKNLVDEMLVTHIEQDFEGDTWFPAIDAKKWTKKEILSYIKDEKNPYNFKVFQYTRTKI
ncbi:MAG: dihydrofolate reductase [Crocinitomicaceae bacterium]|nr:dihydrofolate reductase [Crocinitomicaceae bacterium]